MDSTCLNSNTSVIHMASDMGEDLGLQAELANGFAVCARLLRGCGGCELDVLHTERIERLGNGDFSLGVEKGVGELFTLCERGGSQW